MVKLVFRYMPWPLDALEKVAEYFINSMNLKAKDAYNTQKDFENKSQTGIDLESSAQSLGVVESIVLSDLERSLVQAVIYFNESIIYASNR